MEPSFEMPQQCIVVDCYNRATHNFRGHDGVALCPAHLLGVMHVDTAAVRDAIGARHIFHGGCPVCRDDTRHGLALSLLSEVDRLRGRDKDWGEATVWRSNWMTRAVTLLGDLRDLVHDEFPEHLEELDALLADEFEDGEDDDD
jgi:hypothetical protein